jgi:hypothetical protein
MILDYAGLDAIIGREPGKRRPERIPVSEAKPDQHQADSAWIPPDRSPHKLALPFAHSVAMFALNFANTTGICK